MGERAPNYAALPGWQATTYRYRTRGFLYVVCGLTWLGLCLYLQLSQESPIPSWSESFWFAFSVKGQLSHSSPILSRSLSFWSGLWVNGQLSWNETKKNEFFSLELLTIAYNIKEIVIIRQKSNSWEKCDLIDESNQRFWLLRCWRFLGFGFL